MKNKMKFIEGQFNINKQKSKKIFESQPRCLLFLQISSGEFPHATLI